MLADHHLRRSVENGVDAVAEIALPEDLLPGLEVLAQQQLLVCEAELHQLGRQEEVERPGCGHLHPPPPSRELEKIDGPPQEPRQRPRDLQAEDVRHRRVAPQRSHLAEALEVEGAPLAAAHAGDEI